MTHRPARTHPDRVTGVPTALRRLQTRLTAAFHRWRDSRPPRVRTGIDLVVATYRGVVADRVTGLAAEIAFWVLLSLPPMLLLAASTAGLIGSRVDTDVRTQLLSRIEELARQVFTQSTVEDAITPTLDGLLEVGSPSVLSLSFLVTIYSASRVLRVVVHAIAVVYDREEVRPNWVTRVMGLVFTLAALLIALVLIPVVIAGPRLGEIVETRLHLNIGLREVWQVAYWPVSLVVVTLLLAVLFHVATPVRTQFRRELPGAVLATVLALLASVGLRIYSANFLVGNPLYAPLAAPLAVLVWVWLQGIVLLVGAELNAQVTKANPLDPQVHTPSSARRLGRHALAAARGLLPRDRTPS